MKFSRALIFMTSLPCVINAQGGYDGDGESSEDHTGPRAKHTKSQDWEGDNNSSPSQSLTFELPDLPPHNSESRKPNYSRKMSQPATIGLAENSTPAVPEGNSPSTPSSTEVFDEELSDKPKCGIKYRPDLIILNAAVKPSKEVVTARMKQKQFREPDHDVDATPYLYDARGDDIVIHHEAPRQKSHHKTPIRKVEQDCQEQKDAEQDDKSKVNYGSDGCVECGAITIKKLAHWFGGDSIVASFLKKVAECATKALLLPFVWCGYSSVKCCDLTAQFCCAEEECFPNQTFCNWLSVAREETWVGLGEFCPAMFKCTWFCFKNCAVGTLSCSKRNKIIRCPEKAYHTIKEKCEKMQHERANREPKKTNGCYCDRPGDCGECRAMNACCDKCDACCYAVRDTMVCCCSAAGEMTDFFMCCCHAFVESSHGVQFEAEGCQVFCELLSCCTMCPSGL